MVEVRRKSLPDKDFNEMLGHIRSLFDRCSAELGAVAVGRQRGHALHRMLDATQKPTAGLAITCRRGCSGCCHYEIEVTGDEAEVLAAEVRGGVEIDRARLESQAARERRGREWENILHPDNRCVFLGADGACRVYDSRPAACRRHLVTTPAEACSTPGAPVAAVEVLTTEILLSAAMSLEGTRFASLSKMLKAATAADPPL